MNRTLPFAIFAISGTLTVAVWIIPFVGILESDPQLAIAPIFWAPLPALAGSAFLYFRNDRLRVVLISVLMALAFGPTAFMVLFVVTRDLMR